MECGRYDWAGERGRVAPFIEPVLLDRTKIFLKGHMGLSDNPEHHGRTKHVARRHFFVRDQVKEGEISVRLVKTDDNEADFFSKPLKPSSFFSLRDSIMNIRRE